MPDARSVTPVPNRCESAPSWFESAPSWFESAPSWCKPALPDAPGLSTAHTRPLRSDHGILVYHQGGNFTQLKAPSSYKPEHRGGGQRGKIQEFSRASRRRMMGMVNSINYSKISLPYFVTLTYHHDWPEDPGERKEQVKGLKKRIERVWGSVSYIYRQEHQRRGAPHFHLLLWLHAPEQHIQHPGQRLMRLQNNISWWWNEIADPGNMKHLDAGTNVSSCRNLRHLNGYLSKYVAKVETLAAGIGAAGKSWGISDPCQRGCDPGCKKSDHGWLPVEPVMVKIEAHEFIALRRILRHLSRQRSYEHLSRDDAGEVLGYRIQGMSAFVLAATTTRLLEVLGYYANAPPDTGRGLRTPARRRELAAPCGWPPVPSTWTLAGARDPRRLPGNRGGVRT